MTATERGLRIEGLTRNFGGRDVVHDVSLFVAPGQVTCLLGPSGCGKSTTLRMVAGVERQDRGRGILDGKVLSLPVIKGTEDEGGVDISKLRKETGYITVDPGFGQPGVLDPLRHQAQKTIEAGQFAHGVEPLGAQAQEVTAAFF